MHSGGFHVQAHKQVWAKAQGLCRTLALRSGDSGHVPFCLRAEPREAETAGAARPSSERDRAVIEAAQHGIGAACALLGDWEAHAHTRVAHSSL